MLKSSDDALKSDKWYRVRVTFGENEVVVSGAESGKNTVERLRYTFPEGRPDGKMGLAAITSKVKFDDVKITVNLDIGFDSKGSLSDTWGNVKCSEIS